MISHKCDAMGSFSVCFGRSSQENLDSIFVMNQPGNKQYFYTVIKEDMNQPN